MFASSLRYQIGITLIPGIGNVNAKKLISYCGGVEQVFREKKSTLIKIPGFDEKLADNILSQDILKRAEREIDFMIKNKVEHTFYLDADYPQRLLHCDDGPVMLYYKGAVDFNHPKIISVVGSRKATDYGRKICSNIIEELAANNVIIVSGLAYGIDISAHKAALDNNLKTIAVLGHGLHKIYPFEHIKVAEKIINNGALLTDYLSETESFPENFPKRNRIIAGIADAVLVVEAALKSGTLITAEVANGYNKEVLAVPGRVNDKYSEGCNQLIKTNKAALCTCAADIYYLLNWDKDNKPAKQTQMDLFSGLNSNEKMLVELLSDRQPLSIDNLCMKANMNMGIVAEALLNLEFSGKVKSLPGKRYQLN